MMALIQSLLLLLTTTTILLLTTGGIRFDANETRLETFTLLRCACCVDNIALLSSNLFVY